MIAKQYLISGQFCHAYELNIGGISQKIQCIADMQETEMKQGLDFRIKRLQEQLDKKLGWKCYAETGTCLLQKEYLELITVDKDRCPHYLTDESATQLLSEMFGFIPEQIKIRHWAEKFEINKYGDTQIKEAYQRDAFYDSSDCNYIRFDCAVIKTL